MRKYRIAVIPGDGVGPEIVSEAIRLLNEAGFNAEYIYINAGLKYYEKTGKTIEDNALDIIREADAALKGPIATPVGPGTYASVNVFLRKNLDLYANIRPFRSWRGISIRENVNVVLIRENLEGLYSGIEVRAENVTIALRIITKNETFRICRFAFDYAKKNNRRKVTIVHKANILKVTDGLFRQVFYEVAKEYPELEGDEVIVDAAAYKLVKRPHEFDVLVTPNLYGDILSDLIAGLIGGLGLCGSAQIGDNYAIFEPIHGVAWKYAGKGIANPIGEVTAATLMLRWLAERRQDKSIHNIAVNIDQAVKKVVEEKRILTPDLGGNASTRKVIDEVISELKNFIK